ncbi:MAG TPA: phospholipase D-like domain-containing protein [Gammaproteobacteria bacterium]|nr:phospholipase D-like domain-containing protein [Gammaproteobacteria bacterium]
MTGGRRVRKDLCSPLLWPGRQPFELFTEGDDLYAAMLEAIAGAEREILLESYIFADDEVGRRFAKALAERAGAGVRVRMQLDAAGSLFWASRRLDRFLRDSGINLCWYHRWHWRHPLRYNQRDHRKLLVVDGDRAFLGGFNIHRENSRACYGAGRWRDTHVAVTGALAEQAQAAFRALQQDRPWSPSPDAEPSSAVILPNKSPDCQHRLRCLFDAMFASARRRIEVTTPYFLPDLRTQVALAEAAGRGVDVRLLVPRKGDIAPMRWAARRIFAGLLAAGVRIYGYRPRLLHAKTVAVDGDWATVGTSNLDYRSLFLNHELNLVARSPELAGRLHDQFGKDLAESEAYRAPAGPRPEWSDWLWAPVGWGARRWL